MGSNILHSQREDMSRGPKDRANRACPSLMVSNGIQLIGVIIRYSLECVAFRNYNNDYKKKKKTKRVYAFAFYFFVVVILRKYSAY